MGFLGIRRSQFRLHDFSFQRLGRVLDQAEAAGSVWPPAVAAIRLLMLTGCRRSEILTLRWDDVDRSSGELRQLFGRKSEKRLLEDHPNQPLLDGLVVDTPASSPSPEETITYTRAKQRGTDPPLQHPRASLPRHLRPNEAHDLAHVLHSAPPSPMRGVLRAGKVT